MLVISFIHLFIVIFFDAFRYYYPQLLIMMKQIDIEIIEQPQGRNYSYEEVSKMLIDVGFKNIERRPLAGPAEIVIGYKRSSQK